MTTGKIFLRLRLKTRQLLVVLLFLSWFLFLSPSVCTATDYQITELELTRLEQILNQLETNNNQLLTDLEQSKTDLTQARQLLEKYQMDLAALQAQLLELKKESAQAKTDLEVAQNSLVKVNQYLQEYEKEVKSEIKSLKLQRNLGYLAAIAALFIK